MCVEIESICLSEGLAFAILVQFSVIVMTRPGIMFETVGVLRV